MDARSWVTAQKLVAHDSLLTCVHYAFDLSPPKRKSKTSVISTRKPSAFLSDAAHCLSDSSKSPEQSKEEKREILTEIGWEERQHKNLQDGWFGISKVYLPRPVIFTCFPSQLACCLPFCITAGILYHILPAMVHLNQESMTICLHEGHGCLRSNYVHCNDVSIFLWESGPSIRLWILQQAFRTLKSTCLTCTFILVSVFELRQHIHCS